MKISLCTLAALAFCFSVTPVFPVPNAHAAAGDTDLTVGNGKGYVTYAGIYDAPWFVTGGARD